MIGTLRDQTNRHCCLIRLTVFLIIFCSGEYHSLWGEVPDTSRILNRYEDCKKLLPVSLDSVYSCFRAGLEEAREAEFTNGILFYYRGLSGVQSLRGNVKESLEWTEKALQIIEDQHLSERLKLDFLINKGAALTRAGLPGSALIAYLECDSIARKEGLADKHALILNNLGVIYRQLKRYEEAVRLYHQAIDLRIEQGDTMGLANNYFNLAATYSEKGDYQETITSLSEARKLYRYLDSEEDLILCRLSEAQALFKLGRVEEAFPMLDSLAKMSKPPFQLQDYCGLYITLSRYHNDHADYLSALSALQEIKPYVEPSDLTDVKMEYYRNLSRAHGGMHEYQKAYQAQLSYSEVADTVARYETNRLRREMEERYLSREKDYQIQMQGLQLARSGRNQVLFAIGLMITTFLVFLLFRIGQLRKKVNRQLEEKNAVIGKALQEKDILLREIHHRVKNNLQFISSLLGLQTEHIQDEGALSALQEGQDRVQSMALIHQNLYQEDNLTGVNVKDYFTKLIRNLFDSYNIRKERVQLSMEVDDLNLDVDTVVPIGLIVNELVSNSLKYAFPAGVAGQIRVSLRKEDQGLRLRVWDNGQGMNAGQIRELGKSFGYRLISVLEEQLGATRDITGINGTDVSLFIRRFR